MRAIWTGAIGFGLVNIPLKIFSATQENRPDFDLLERDTLSRIRYKRVNEDTGKEVDWEDIVKGSLVKDRYVVLDDSDFEAASPEKTKLIDIQNFVKEADIDSIYFDSPYFLSPAKGGEKAYSLLLVALKKTKMVGLATFVMRNAESLAVIRPYNSILLLNTLRFQEQIRQPDDIKPSAVKIGKAEMDMAVQLIKRHSGPFNPQDFKDEYSKELKKLIAQKAKGKAPKVRKLKPSASKSSDLLEQLKASLA